MSATTENRTAPGSPARVSGTVRYWAAAKSAAGRAEQSFEAATLADALAAVRAAHADRPELLRLLEACSFLLDGEQVGGREHAGPALSEGWTVEVLPPFAGG
ncbi:MoaD/ThiS family protein [Kitasatospora phosalacinea]|uniref:Thiamine biosynthesis protein ThiS n=1 Tax=Kitasatospora phosalacinea TaxID=2065 RepID=A0A9W6PHU4_9ACTN|nr:MoaD/ThiS family protein [Kitasatospora phosalacinea]GLW55178.1 thiamine biosynthesis protein ThiS [Kitasatospora phosalacinea]